LFTPKCAFYNSASIILGNAFYSKSLNIPSEKILTEMIDLDSVRQVRDFDGDGEFPIHAQGICQDPLFRDLAPLRLPRTLDQNHSEETDP
jgi:hypothetical protein